MLRNDVDYNVALKMDKSSRFRTKNVILIMLKSCDK